MIYLIGGPPRCGKSTLAKKIARKKRISWISADSLESIAVVYTPKSAQIKKFPKTMMRRQTKQSNDAMYNRYTPQQVATAYKQQSLATWPAVEQLVAATLRADQDLVIEGHQLHPKLMHMLIERHGQRSITATIIMRRDITQTAIDARKNTAPDDWFIAKTTDPATDYKIAEMIVRYGAYLEKEADKYTIPVTAIDDAFHKTINNLAQSL